MLKWEAARGFLQDLAGLDLPENAYQYISGRMVDIVGNGGWYLTEIAAAE
jgi:hypothetical protein